jgi:L-gulono-1,4-lactone dehydrogenase
MVAGWTNWAGDQHCVPAAIERPASLDELQTVVRAAAARGQRVRAAGSGHSFTEIALTDAVLVRLDRLDRVLDVDREGATVKVEAGIVLADLNRRLDDLGLALENLGDIDRQTLAGSISTGTHGTGVGRPSISAQVEAVELVGADGELQTISAGDELEAARIGLGALGLIYSVRLRIVPAFTLDRVDSPKPLADVLASLEELTKSNDHFEFYVFPHTSLALCRESRRTDEPPRPRNAALVYAQEVMLENWVGGAFTFVGRHIPSLTPRLAKLAAAGTGRARKVDRSFKVFASERRIKFTEMEYAIPREHAAEAVPRVLEVAARPEHPVAFPIEVRFASADTPLLSTSHGRDTAYVAVHQDPKLAWEPYFREVERIMDGYGGRPHWGKRHFQTAATLAPRYPRWADFTTIRNRLDSQRRFANDYVERVLGS